MTLTRVLLAVLFVLLLASAVGAATPLIEVQVAKKTYEGKVIAHDDRSFLMITRDGRLHSFATTDVGKYRQVAPAFQSWSTGVVRDQLRRELGKPFEIAGTRHYVVAARSEQLARQYAETFEELFRTFQHYFSVRGFQVPEPEFPLVAIVFPDYQSFGKYAKAEQVSVSPNLRGYYLSVSNRVALYEGEPSRAAGPQPAFGGLFAPRHEADNPFVWAATEASLKDTMIHEATHQVAFNTGLHARLGWNPKWVVEGLATVFEAAGIRNPGTNLGVKTRLNPDRFIWFGNFQKSRRKPKSLEAFLASDELFQQSALDAYSQAWAFSFFLIETRPRPYADYLRTIAARNPLAGYSPDERLADFKKTVSKDLPLLEAEFLRFIGDIK